jgi:glutamate-5-semialdehyde dehydrogenase
MAVKVTVDSKTQYVAVCNAAETLLVHQDIAAAFLPRIKDALEEKGVELRGCERTAEIIDVRPASEADWSTEYLDLILSIRIVNNLDEAIDHINRYGSGHTDVIISSDRANQMKFMDYVDSAGVFVNCSSRFSDGFRYGLGAEVGISTSKIHARGPVGLEGMVIYKWRLVGTGQTVAEYAGESARSFIHKRLEKDFRSFIKGGKQ